MNRYTQYKENDVAIMNRDAVLPVITAIGTEKIPYNDMEELKKYLK